MKLYLFALQLLLWEVPQMSITAKELAEKLIGESTNLNQLAKRANAYGFYRVADECRTVAQQISQLIKQLKDDR